MASAAYEINLKKFMDGDIDLLVDTIKVRPLRTSAYTFSQAHDFMNETGMTALETDVTLGTKATAVDGSGVTFDAADAVFTAFDAGAAVNCLIVFKFVTNDADSLPILYLDGFSVVPNGGDITFQWAAATPHIWKIAV